MSQWDRFAKPGVHVVAPLIIVSHTQMLCHITEVAPLPNRLATPYSNRHTDPSVLTPVLKCDDKKHPLYWILIICLQPPVDCWVPISVPFQSALFDNHPMISLLIWPLHVLYFFFSRSTRCVLCNCNITQPFTQFTYPSPLLQNMCYRIYWLHDFGYMVFIGQL